MANSIMLISKMESHDDLELDGNDGTRSKSCHGVRKNIAIKLKNGGSKSGSKSQGRAVRRTTRSSRSSTKAKKESPPPPEQPVDAHVPIEDDIMEDMEFSTMKVTGVEPTHKMQKLKWDHKVNLLGMKVIDPIIHTCETCELPILLYGRMIPCKHVFCFDCAKKKEKVCTRCGDPVNRVEQSALGAVFVCNFGGSKHGASGCRRTYLSQRDLQAHINYRHLKQQNEQQQTAKPTPNVQPGGQQLSVPPGAQQLSVPPGAQQLSVQHVAQQPSVSAPSMAAEPTVQTSPYGLAHAAPMLSPNMPVVQPQTHQQTPLQQHDLLYQVRSDTMSHSQPAVQPHVVQQQMHPALTPPLNQAPPPPAHVAPQTSMMAPPPVSAPLDTYQSIPVMTNRTSNLITVPIQDETDYSMQDNTCYTASTSQYMHPPPSQPIITNLPPKLYNTGSHHPQIPQITSYSSGTHPQPQGMPPTGHPPPPQAIINSCPPLINTPMNLPPMNLSQPPPAGPMGVPRQTRPANTGPPQAMMGNRYPNPTPQTMYNQPPPNNTRNWQGGPPPRTGHMGGPPPQGPPPQGPPPQRPPQQRPQANSTMGPRPSRPFYQ